MEFVKLGKNYLIKNSNGKVVSEKEKIELENKELIFKDITGCNCQKETTKKLTKNKKRLKEIEQEELKIPILKKIAEDKTKKDEQKEKTAFEFKKDDLDRTINVVKIETNTAQIENGDVADDTIEEADTTI